VKKTGVLTDSAVFDLRYRKGYKNLPMTSFKFILQQAESLQRSAVHGTWMHSVVQCCKHDPEPQAAPGIFGQSYKWPADAYWLSGDPVSGNSKTDWLDARLIPGDRRFLLTRPRSIWAVG